MIDNALLLAVANVFFLFVLLAFLLPLSFVHSAAIAAMFASSASFVLFVLFFSVSDFAVLFSNDKSASIQSFFLSIKKTIPSSLVFSAFLTALGILFSIALPFYFSFSNFFGKLLAFSTVWFAVFLLLTLQWLPAVFALQTESERNLIPCIKKSIFIFVDNTFFSLFLFLHTLVLIFISFFSFALFPSFSGVALSYVNAAKLRLRKYDFAENKKKKIDWNEVLADEKKTLSARNFASIFFPWKRDE